VLNDAARRVTQSTHGCAASVAVTALAARAAAARITSHQASITGIEDGENIISIVSDQALDSQGPGELVAEVVIPPTLTGTFVYNNLRTTRLLIRRTTSAY